MLVSFLGVSAVYRVGIGADAKALYWKGISFYCAMVFLDYFMGLIAFGYQPKHRNYLIFDTAVCLYLIVAYCLRQYSFEDQSN